ncbi:hypothetical protein B296_00028124 [Ensete ventricosum]|uniref:Uncharacterized protein n=1 Tax=Ensete ventricosum TaxID=4639 RepID=A0A427ADT0_ENSVE|nr:hypothetical protein B296_00028124 [Ensete ventricosum]
MGLITHNRIYVCIGASPCPVIVHLVIISSISISGHQLGGRRRACVGGRPYGPALPLPISGLPASVVPIGVASTSAASACRWLAHGRCAYMRPSMGVASARRQHAHGCCALKWLPSPAGSLPASTAFMAKSARCLSVSIFRHNKNT